MRARLVRPALVLATAASGVLALGAHAAAPGPVTVSYTDPKGDANAINSQGEPVPGFPSSTGTPAGSQDTKDIVGVTYTSTGTVTKLRHRAPQFTCTGFTATMTLAGAPETTNTLYRLESNSAAGMWWLQYANGVAIMRIPAAPLLGIYPQTQSIPLKTPPVIAGNSVTWVVTAADVAATGGTLPKFILSGMSADVRTSTPAATVPAWDQAAPGDGATSFKPC